MIGDFLSLLITIANRLHFDQAQQNDWPDLDQLLDTLMLFVFLIKLYDKRQKRITKLRVIMFVSQYLI